MKRAPSAAFASSNHGRDVFKESRRDREEVAQVFLFCSFFFFFFNHNGPFKWGILPVYPAAEGNRHFV